MIIPYPQSNYTYQSNQITSKERKKIPIFSSSIQKPNPLEPAFFYGTLSQNRKQISSHSIILSYGRRGRRRRRRRWRRRRRRRRRRAAEEECITITKNIITYYYKTLDFCCFYLLLPKQQFLNQTNILPFINRSCSRNVVAF